MAILIMSHNVKNPVIQEMFQHSGETVSRHFHSVLAALQIFAQEMIQSPSFEETPPEIKSNRKYFSFFANCIGAIDGTHMRFPVLKMMPQYSFKTQVLMVIACVTMHSFIRKQTTSDLLFEKTERGELDNEEDSDNDDDEVVNIENVVGGSQQQRWEAYRKEISNQIEEAYRD
ncbi:uncharacterized protein LOC122651655 [Telopea speciosissima]|uniref:uncharacterized protein LOC122651655 n=1 Tax=Telopea speciosissima TaxID=54955 RepID=UPI001CC8207B|nr:uncharacterized protein LOC122651655 [Telopea speciosissima]